MAAGRPAPADQRALRKASQRLGAHHGSRPPIGAGDIGRESAQVLDADTAAAVRALARFTESWTLPARTVPREPP